MSTSNDIEEKLTISIVVPTLNCKYDLQKLIKSLELQTIAPMEVLIADSSINTEIEDVISSYNGPLNLIFLRNSKKFPGEKRNFGAKVAKGELISFLDVGTLPKPEWLEAALAQIYDGYDVVFGSTQYKCLNSAQELIRAATFGNRLHETSPGSLLKRLDFELSGGFIENTRAGDDLEWRQALRDFGLRCFTPTKVFLEYSNLPSKLFDMQKRYFLYYIHSGKFKAQRNTRDLYLGALLILSALVIPRWNYLIGGWSENSLYIPNITKIYIISFLVLTASYLLANRFLIKRKSTNLLQFILKLFAFVLIALTIFYWNANIAKWVEDTALYIPHITKIYIALIISSSVMYRGIYLPIKSEIPSSYLFPTRWLMVGLAGFSLDLMKVPGTLLGICLAPFQKNK